MVLRVLPYLWLSLALGSLWLPPRTSGRSWPLRLPISSGWLALAIVHAYVTGIVSPIGILAIAAFGLLCLYSSRTRLAAAATIPFSLALMAHVVPGFANLLVIRDAVLGPGAMPYTLYLNFDKAQIGLFVLAFGPPLLKSHVEWMTMLRAALPRVLVVILVLMVFALSIGQVRVDVKWPEIFPTWAWSNLLFTCASEEALFRGVIQRWLQGASVQAGATSARGVVGLAIAAVIFGAAHFAGGVGSIMLATIAGLGYGWIFWRTGRIEGSILAHFLVNTAHILGFTYPAVA
jgi:membrane protease YdiL (CAAX protease family)